MDAVDERRAARSQAFELMVSGRKEEGESILHAIREEVGGKREIEPPLSPRKKLIRNRRAKIKALLVKEPNLTNREIARRIGSTDTTVRKDRSFLRGAGELK